MEPESKDRTNVTIFEGMGVLRKIFSFAQKSGHTKRQVTQYLLDESGDRAIEGLLVSISKDKKTDDVPAGLLARIRKDIYESFYDFLYPIPSFIEYNKPIIFNCCKCGAEVTEYARGRVSKIDRICFYLQCHCGTYNKVYIYPLRDNPVIERKFFLKVMFSNEMY